MNERSYSIATPGILLPHNTQPVVQSLMTMGSALGLIILVLFLVASPMTL